MFGSPKCPDIIYVVFFRNRISASICLTFTQFSIVSLVAATPNLIWCRLAMKKTILGRQKKTNGCMEKGWKFLWDWIRIYILQGFMSLGNTAQLGWLQKNVCYFAPSKKNKQGISEQTLYFCSHALLCEFVGRLLNVTRVTRTPHLEKKCLWREKNKEQRIRCGAQNPEHTTKVSSGKRAAKNGFFHISSSLKACQSHLELYHWCWSDIAETSCSKCTPWGPRTPMPLTLFKTNPSHLPMTKHTLQAILATIPGGWCKSPLILISWNHLIEGLTLFPLPGWHYFLPTGCLRHVWLLMSRTHAATVNYKIEQ